MLDSKEGVAVFGRYVIDGELFACPFLFGYIVGRLDMVLSSVVGTRMSLSVSSAMETPILLVIQKGCL